MPFKAKAACRRHIPKQQHRVINWAAYDAGLRARGSLTVWFTTEAIEAWRAPSTCSAVVEGVRAAWAGRLDGYAKAATPVTSAQV